MLDFFKVCIGGFADTFLAFLLLMIPIISTVIFVEAGLSVFGNVFFAIISAIAFLTVVTYFAEVDKV